jgi:hypothetical protein
VHVNVASVHDQPVPAIAVADNPVGKPSTTDAVPAVAAVPTLLATRV